jgi:hypothetical protein
MRTSEAIKLVEDARCEQIKMHLAGRFKFTCASPQLSDQEKLTLLLRELGEVARCVGTKSDLRESLLSEQTIEKLRTELAQVAAVAVAWIEGL